MKSFTEYCTQMSCSPPRYHEHVSLHLFSDLSGSNLANESQSQAFIHFCQIDFVDISFLIILLNLLTTYLFLW